MKRLLWGMGALGLFLGVTGQAKADYIFTTLDPPGSIRTEAQGINRHGAIVGFYEDADHIVHGFLRTGTEYFSFDVPAPGTIYTQGSGINDCGDIVGRYMADDGQHGYLRRSDGTYVLRLDPPDARSGTQPYAINNAGQIVGWYDDAQGRSHGFLLSEGKYTTIDPPRSTLTFAEGINNFGVITGVYQGERGRRGYVRLSGGRFIYPPAPEPDTFLSNNIGINDLGQISGSDIDARNVRHGFVLEYGQYTTLDPPGGHNVFASGINASGWIVGPYNDAQERIHGFLAVPDDDRTFSRPSFRNGRSDSEEQKCDGRLSHLE